METSNSDFSLKGKKVVILGGSSGLGLATARAAAAEGANVVIVSSNAARVHARMRAGLSARAFARRWMVLRGQWPWNWRRYV